MKKIVNYWTLAKLKFNKSKKEENASLNISLEAMRGSMVDVK